MKKFVTKCEPVRFIFIIKVYSITQFLLQKKTQRKNILKMFSDIDHKLFCKNLIAN